MAADPFNSVGGYTVGIPAVTVIDSSGNVVSNFLNLSGNVSANNFYANHYYYANGQPFVADPGGSNTQLQFNNNGVLGGIPNVTYNGNILSLGNISALSIGGGNNGYFLQTDGLGNLAWAAGGGGNGAPGGVNTQVQFNNNGTFGGDINFTYNSSTDTVSLINLNANGIVNLGTVANVKITGGVAGYYLRTDGAGNLTWSTGSGGNGTPGGSNTQVQFNDENDFAGNSQFTFDKDTGTLGISIIDAGDISADIIGANGLTIAATIDTSNINVTTRANVSGNLRAVGNVNFSTSPNIYMGTISNIHITGGVNGYVLSTDGTGNLSWIAGGGGGNGAPGGSNTQIQYNSSGSFGGSAFFTFNDYTNTVQIGGNLIANSLQIGAGAYKYCTSFVYFATTASAGSNQILYSIPISEISAVDFEIVATNPAGPSRQFCKITSLYYDGTVQFNEYASLFVNGGVGNFEVDYNAGNIIVPPALELKVTPSVATLTTYKMLITVYSP